MRRSQQAFSAPSKQTQSSNAKDELSSTASINASSTTLIPSSELLASKPRDSTLKREQNSCYDHDNGLSHTGLSSPAYRDWAEYNALEDGRAVGHIDEDRRVMLAVGICRTSCITSLAQRALEVRCRRICSPWRRTSLARPGSSKLRSLPPFPRRRRGRN